MSKSMYFVLFNLCERAIATILVLNLNLLLVGGEVCLWDNLIIENFIVGPVL